MKKKYSSQQQLFALLCFALLLPYTVFAQASDTTQTDWQGGTGIEGPVTDFGNQFYQGTNINFSTSGEIILTKQAAASPVKHLIGDPLWPRGASTLDMDGDGDTDVTCTIYYGVGWYENNDSIGTSWTYHSIGSGTENFIPRHPLGDIDGDTDPDIVTAVAYNENSLAWWSNNDGVGGSWTKHTIASFTNDPDPSRVDIGYIDDDTDLDVLAVMPNAGEIAWWSNDNGSGTSWTKYTIDSIVGAIDVYLADMDGDSDLDVVFSSSVGKAIWWENLDGSGTSWTKHVIYDYEASSYVFIHINDIDGDGDLDVGSCNHQLQELVWFKNLDGSGTSWDKYTIQDSSSGLYYVYSVDVDVDGDIDVFSYTEGGISWWENLDGSGTSWTKHTIADGIDGTTYVRTGDIDGNGDIDAVGAAYKGVDDIAWWDILDGYHATGELISSIFDTEGNVDWDTIEWLADTPLNTAVKFQVRSSNDPGNLGGWSADISVSGTDLSGYASDGDRYIQYKAIFETTDSTLTPALQEVTITYQYPPAAPTNLAATPGDGQVSLLWDANDESDLHKYNIYRDTSSPASTLVDSVVGAPPDTSCTDTGLSNSTTYYYRITAVDTAGNESGYSNEVSATPWGPLAGTYNIDAAGNGDFLTLPVPALHGAFHRTAYIPLESGYAQTAFGPELLPFLGDNLRIDQFDQPAVLLTAIHHDNAFKNADLGRGQSDALGLVHGIRHVVQKFLDVRGDLRNRLGQLTKHRVRFFYN